MTVPTPGPRLAFWPRWLGPGRLAKRATDQPPDPLRSIGQVLRESREAKGLRLRDLAQRTRISIAVLEALEKGWKERLPEATYLRTMLHLLEHELDLPAGSLEAVLPHVDQGTIGRIHRPGPGVAVLHPFSNPVLTRWQGALAYSLLTLGLLYAVNLQQQRLARLGLLAVRPIPLAPLPPEASPPPPSARRQGPTSADPSPSAFPDLAPLSKAATGQAMDLLIQETHSAGGDRSLGLLSLRLRQPTRLDLRGPRNGTTRLEGLQGEITLPVLPPFELRLSPPPGAAAVRWRDKPLAQRPSLGTARATPDQPTSGLYTVPVTEAPSAVRSPASPKSR